MKYMQTVIEIKNSLPPKLPTTKRANRNKESINFILKYLQNTDLSSFFISQSDLSTTYTKAFEALLSLSFSLIIPLNISRRINAIEKKHDSGVKNDSFRTLKISA